MVHFNLIIGVCDHLVFNQHLGKGNMGINILPLEDGVLDDTLETRKSIRSPALLTCWTWGVNMSFFCENKPPVKFQNSN